MVTFIIIVAVIAGIILYIRFLSYIDNQRYLTEHEEVFAAHKKLGYPQLTLTEQYNLLDNENLEPVLKLTEYKFVPDGLLNYYINIEPREYFDHLKASNLEEKMKFDPDDLTDGFYINKTKRATNISFAKEITLALERNFQLLISYLIISFMTA